MFKKHSEGEYRSLAEGALMKTLTYGEKTMMVEFQLKKGTVVPMHKHSHEQIGYLIKGKLQFVIGGETYNAEAGDSWCIEGNIEHSAEALEDSIAIEVFTPPREDYMP